ncbi:4-hydroxy-tetrahydrodipicolinate synthase [Candidatus Avelusimicrobium luingense]|uniref:4-hydroxy-tetrahydrodipicolinate synthase n=1 Tax=Candidatus Avelusimicrobium luingense TaxID=3416211 RepID=UPI003D098E2D
MSSYSLIIGTIMFNGIFTALATPFLPDGKIDFSALENLLSAQLAAHIDGVVLLGTTAETPTLSADEKKQILDFCVPRLAGKCKIIIGTGANNTQVAVENTRAVAPYNPDAVLVVTPYYNKPNPAGLIAHYQAVAEVGLPIILYHIPGRTGLKLPDNVLADLLANVPQIVGIKESDYDASHVMQTAVSYTENLDYLCGNDDLFPQYLAINASGIISAAANVFAPAFVQIYQLFQAGKTKESFALFAQLYPFIKACYAETNPTCIKYMLAKLGFGSATVRLPLGEISAAHKEHLDTLFQTANPSWLIK